MKKTSPKKTRAEKSAAVPKPKAEEARKKPADQSKKQESKQTEMEKPVPERIPEKKISVPAPEPEKSQETSVAVQPKPEPVQETISKTVSRTEPTPSPEPAAEPVTTPRKVIFSRLGEKLREIPEFFKKLRAVILAIGQLLKKQLDRIKALFHSLAELKAKIDHYIEIWQEEETQNPDPFRKVIFYICIISGRERKRLSEIWPPDPAITGQLTGFRCCCGPWLFQTGSGAGL